MKYILIYIRFRLLKNRKLQLFLDFVNHNHKFITNYFTKVLILTKLIIKNIK